MALTLHAPNGDNQLSEYYKRAFANCVELVIVSAYLTEWDESLVLNPACTKLRIIIGQDFGITRKAACVQVLRWLKAGKKHQFLVAERIQGFHPKAVFWKEGDGKAYVIVGSSNLTRAAFDTNYEANGYLHLSAAEYAAAERWIEEIETKSVGVSEDWLKDYVEAAQHKRRGSGRGKIQKGGVGPPVTFELPKPAGMKEQLNSRRAALVTYAAKRAGLMNLFHQCASGAITSERFFDELPQHWSMAQGNRLQGAGWERQGKNSDFQMLAKSFLKIVNTKKSERDDVVAEEIDRLRKAKNHARKAFLSEMLCLRFPDQYPVLNKPVGKYLAHVRFRAPRGASEGARYVDLARKLRYSLMENPNHPAKNLAELDTVIWLKYRQ